MTPLPTSPPPDEPDPALGKVIRRLREERGLTAAALADRSGVGETSLAQIEAGATDPPWASVAALAAALGVSLESIATAVEDDERQAP